MGGVEKLFTWQGGGERGGCGKKWGWSQYVLYKGQGWGGEDVGGDVGDWKNFVLDKGEEWGRMWGIEKKRGVVTVREKEGRVFG